MFSPSVRRVAIVLVGYVLVSSWPAGRDSYAQGPQPAKRAAEFGMAVEKNVMIPMRDGVRLAADVYRPARDGKPAAGRFPTVLTRTPYDKTGAGGEGQYYAERGYVVVANDVRGRYASEGTWRLIVDDPQDGYDVVEWIARQDWSDGKIGTFGTSYPGGTQHALAEMNPPHLTTLVPIDAVSNCGVSGMRHGGAFELRFMNWIFQTGAPNSKAALANPALHRPSSRAGGGSASMPTICRSGPARRRCAWSRNTSPGWWRPCGAGPRRRSGTSKGCRSSITWATMPTSRCSISPAGTIPRARQVTMNYIALSLAKKSPQRLVIGPWVHGSQTSNIAGEVEFTKDAGIDLLGFRLRWYDRWMRGEKNGVDEDPVLIYIMGTGDDRRSVAGRLQHGGSWRRPARMAPARAHGKRHSTWVRAGSSPPRRRRPVPVTPRTPSIRTIPCRRSAATSRRTRD